MMIGIKGGEIMANTENVTTKFKVDISDLKKNIAEANRQVKTYNAEIKNASAGMAKGEETVDSLSKKIEAQSKVVDAEKSKLDALKQQLERYNSKVTEGEGVIADLTRKHQEATATYGENSEEVKALAKQLKDAQEAQERNKTAVENLNVQIINQDTAVKNAEAQVKNYKSALDKMQTEADESISSIGTLTDRVESQREKLQKLKDKYVDVVTQQGATSEEAKDLATKIQDLSGKLKENQTELNQAEQAANELDQSLEDVGDEANNTTNGGLAAIGEKLQNLAADLIKAAVNKLKDFVTQTIEVGKAFDTSMSQVGAVSGATAEDMELLRDKAKEMGSSTKFTASEAADAMNYMAMAGWKTEDMLGGIDGIMNLAAASGSDLATTSDIVTDALTAMGYSANKSGELADVMAAASSNANTNVELLGESFEYVAPVAGSMGSSMEDLSIALGLMANSGIKGSNAGNSLKNALVNLVKPTEQQTIAMEKLGLMTTETVKTVDSEKLAKAQTRVKDKTLDLEKAQIKVNEAVSKYGEDSSQAQTAMLNLEGAQNNLTEAQRELNVVQEGTIKTVSTGQSAFVDEYGNMKSLRDIMEVLRSTMGAVNVELVDSDGNMREYDDIINELSQTEDGLTQAEQLKNAAIIFGKQNLSGMLAIINASEEDYNKLTDAIDNCGGTAEDMANTMLDNLGGDMTLLKSKLEGVQLAIYEKFEPAMRKGVELLDKLLNAVQFVVDHSTEFVVALGAMAAGVAAYLAYTTAVTVMTKGWKALTVVTKAQAAAQAILNTVMSLNPIGLLVAALVGLIATFVLLWKKCDWFREFWINVWEKIKEVTSSVVESLKKVFGNIAEYWSGVWNGIKEKAVSIWESITGFFSGTGKKIKTTFENVGNWFEGKFIEAYSAIQNVWNTVIEFFSGLWEGIKSIFSTVAEWIDTNVFQPIKELFQPVVDFFVTSWNIISELAKGCWEAIKIIWDIAKEWFEEHVIQPVVGFFTDLWEVISSSAEIAWDKIKTVWNIVSTWFKDHIITPLCNFFTAYWNFISALAKNSWEFIKNIWNVVATWFKDHIITPLCNFFTAYWNFISALAKNSWEFIKNIWNVVATWFKDHIITPLSNFFTAYWNFVSTLAKTSWETIKKVWNVVSDWFNQHVIQPVKNFFTGMWNGLKTGASNAWTGIKNVFSNVSDWFKDVFSKAWQKVKDVFSTGGKIFTGIKEGIENAFKTVVNAIIRGINKVIAFPFDKINDMLDRIRDVEIAGFTPFSGLISRFTVPQIPELEQGGIVKKGQVGLLEGKGAEAVIPLERNTGGLKRITKMLAAELKPQLEIGGAGNSYNNQQIVNNYNFNQTNNSPKALSRLEIYRQSKNLLRMKG